MRDATPLLFDLPGFRVIECVEELGGGVAPASHPASEAVPRERPRQSSPLLHRFPGMGVAGVRVSRQQSR